MKNIYLDENGNQIKTKVIYTPSGEDDQDYEEVLLSDSEKFETTELKDEDNIPL